MNIRNVLRTYSLLRQLTDDESALLETLRNATEAEREMLVETLAQQRSSTTKRAGKKSSSKGASKSSRASGMAAAINRSLSQQRQVVKSDDDDDNNCGFVHGDGNGHVCGLLPDHNIHHLQNYVDYHPFASTAPRAGAKSSTNGGATESTASSGDETVSAGAVAGGSSES